MASPKTFFVILILICSSVHIAGAATYYVDPVNGDIANTGDKENPWDTLEQVFRRRKALAAGDTLLLYSGHHGTVNIRGENTDYITILPVGNNQPTIKRINFGGAKKWKLIGMTISPETAPEYMQTTLLRISNSSSDIIVDNCMCYSVENSSAWSKNDWNTKACSGASIEGHNNVIKNSHFLNVEHGVLVESSARENLIDNNVVENFAADGMRGIGSHNTFQYNTIKNCYDVDENHDDGFQSYSQSSEGVGKTTVYDIVLRGNIIINSTDPNQKYKGTLQGIGCFDGMYEDWLVENNIVITDHWHGISLYGARNCTIINNTVVDLNDSSPGPPWIKITAHKNGTKSENNIIRNNLTTTMSNDANIGEVDHNIIVKNYDRYFTDYDNFDLRLKKDCPAVDAGSDNGAPPIDIAGTSRPQGDGVDIGAYEYTENTGVSNESNIPDEIQLSNYPNPFNRGTVIDYQLPIRSSIELSIYNILGHKICTLADEVQNAGQHSVHFNADQLSSGVYFYRIKTNRFERIRKMSLQK